jgi:hypothetical protein
MFNDWVYRRFPQGNTDGDAADAAAVNAEIIKHCIPGNSANPTVTVDIPLSKLHHNFEEMGHVFVGLG